MKALPLAWQRLIPALVFVALFCAACGAPVATSPTTASQSTAPVAEERELIVFAAASLADAFDEIGTTFETQNPGTTVSFNFGGSQQLAQQLAQGAPADVFASANQRQMNTAIEAGRVGSDTAQVFVRNRLVVVYPAENPANLQTLADLARPGLKLLVAAPEVPVGAYTLDFLAKASALPEYTASYSPTVLANVVSYEDNVRAVLQKVALGEADAGVVYASDITPNEASEVGTLDIPDRLNTLASYPIAAVVDAQQAELAHEFIAYVLSPDGQAVLTRYGFIGK